MRGKNGQMGWGKRILLSWVLVLAVHESRGRAMFPTNSPAMPVAASPKEVSSNLFPVNHSHSEGSSSVISPAPVIIPAHPSSSPVISSASNEVQSPSNTAHAPLMSLPGSSFDISPAPNEANNPSNSTPSPWTSHPSSSPVISPAQVQNPSNVIPAPVMSHMASPPSTIPSPHEVKNPSNIAPGPWTSHSSPVTSPVLHDVMNPYNPSQSPAISPVPQFQSPSSVMPAPVMSHMGSPPLTSPSPHVVKNPSNNAPAPWTSHPSPVISPVPHDVKNPFNTSHPPVTLHPVSSPLVSPTPREVKNPSNTTLGPSTSHSSVAPVISPAPHEIKNPSSPTASPSTSFPAISPVPHQIKNFSNIPPAPSTPYHSSSPMVSPEPHEVKNHSNTTHAPLTSEPGFPPVISPASHGAKHAPNITYAPIASLPQPPAASTFRSPASAPSSSVHHHKTNTSVGNHAAAPFSVLPPSSDHPVEGPAISKAPSHSPQLSKDRQRHHAPPVYVQGPSLSPIRAPYSSDRDGAPSPSPLLMVPSRRNEWPIQSPILPPSGSLTRKPIAPFPQHVWAPPPSSGPIHSPMHSPSGSFSRKPRAPAPQPVWRLPSPPSNFDCNSLQCLEPLANSPPGTPCACVLPIKVKLRLGVALYTFFPLVSELAQEIAAGIFMKQSQVRIMGANAANVDPEKTVILIDLVPLGKYFDNTTAFLVYEKFWHKQVVIEASFFGGYDVLYVYYPGLPPSPPAAPSDINVDNGVYVNGNNARTIHPLGVDVRKQKQKVSGSLIAIIVLSSVIALVFVTGAAWLLMLKNRNHPHLSTPTTQALLPTFVKPSGTGPTTSGSRLSSASASFSSGIPTYAGSAKTFSLSEIERATKRFDDSRIIGEGGFGRVYEGTLEDGTRVAVKVLKRDDQQGGREFLAEVEMLGRLHHRNLVKLVGICTEDIRCLVYELIPNGSVESHLHGIDKETSPLDWSARVKIALGAARALAYLHEDSSPRVIHRDFKSSNILLEHDFTPKVSDFGLARAAMDGGNEHISTRVMGTFGYVAPEYAMTGHLLVKSDVYSYGVVLLELLTGRKPVDMLQPPGQENLVTWARPLLTTTDGLDSIVDPALGNDVQFDSVAKVAAIASMCVQPEVSHRPFMGEVVQALKLVCNESDEYRISGSYSRDELSGQDKDIKISTGLELEAERRLSSFDIFGTSAMFTRDASGSFRRYSSSGPLEAGRSRQFQRERGLSAGSMSEHGVALRYTTGSEGHEQWP